MIKQIIITGCLIFAVCLTGCNRQKPLVSDSNEIIKQKNKKQGEIFKVNTKIKDIINDSTFKGYGRLIFPVDIKIDDNLRLQDINVVNLSLQTA